MIPVDVETFPFSVGCMAPPIVCLQSGERLVADGWREAAQEVFDGGCYGHHVAFDSCVVMANAPELIPTVFAAYDNDRVSDTMLRQQLAEIERGEYKWSQVDGRVVKTGYSLADVARRVLGIELAKGGVQVRFGELLGVPLADWPAAFVEYALHDVLATKAIFERQPSSPDEYRQARADLWLTLASTWGVTTDQGAVSALEASLIADRERVKDTLIASGLVRANGSRDTKAASARLVAAYDGRECPVTDGGQPSLSREACENSGDELLEHYAAYTRIASYLSTNIKMLREPLIHTSYISLRETGRTSSREPNIQNFPRKYGFRECIIPRPGKCFVVLDYAGAELATLAQACLEIVGKSKLADALNDGIDPHTLLAERMGGIPYDTLRAHRKMPRESIEYVTADNLRQTGKVGNFGLPGGLGAKTLVHYAKQSYGVTLTIDQAYRVKDYWLSLWPEMRDYFAFVDHNVSATGRIEQLYSGRVRGGCSYTSGCNTIFQGLAGDMTKDAGWRIAREMYNQPSSPLFGARIVNFVHDEYVIECAPEAAHDVDARATMLMREAAGRWIPRVRIGIESFAARRYGKGVKRTEYQGRLVVTEN